jgi:hypothetical protein
MAQVIVTIDRYPRLARYLHQYEVTGKSLLEEEQGKPLWPESPEYDIGIPSVEKGMTDNNMDFCYFTEPWQLYSFALIKMRVREVMPNATEVEIIRKAKIIFRAGYRDNAFQTNKAGSTTCCDYVNKTNGDAEDMKLETIITGGNYGMTLGPQMLFYGAVVHKIRCFDGTKPPPDPLKVNWHTRPELVGLATIETRIMTADGGREIRQFEFQGVSGFPYFVLVKGRDYFYLGKDRLRFE